MSRAEDKSLNLTIQNILAVLSGFKSGNYTHKVEFTDDPVLSLIVDRLNEVAQVLEAQAQAQGQGQAQGQADLKRSEALLHLANEAAEVGLWSVDNLANGIGTASETYYKIYGQSARTGLPSQAEWHSWIHPEDLKGAISTLERALQKGGTYCSQFRIIRPDQTMRWLETRGKVNRGTDGQPVSMLGAVVDITEIKEQEIQFDHYFMMSLDLLCIMGADGKFKKVNPAFSKTLGYSENELTTRPLEYFIHSDDINKTLKEIEKLATGIKTINFENRFRCRDGSYRILNWTASPDSLSGPFYGAARDVTETRVREAELRQVMDALERSAIVAVTDKGGRIIRVNDNFCRISGYKCEELIGQDHRILNSGAHSKEFFTQLWKTISSGKVWSGEIRNKTKDGKYYFVQTVISPLLNIAGDIEQFLAVRFDITAQRHAEEEKLKILELFNAVLKNIPSMIYVKDFTKKLSYSLLNTAGETLLGVKEEQLLGKTDYDLFPKEQADVFTQMDKDVFSKHAIVRVEKGVINTPIGERFLMTYKVPTFDKEGKPQLLIGISNDITDELKAKADLELARVRGVQHARLASMGEMSAGIAHEINNPLAIIEGTARTLAKFIDDPQGFAQKITTINKSCERISRIVRSLKKFSRSDDKLHLSSYSLCGLVTEALILTESKAKKNDTPVIQGAEPGIDSTILCDEIEIEQVIVNLINNSLDAVKGNSEKWVKVSVSQDVSSIILRVTDSGRGIPKEIQSKIFDPFFTTKVVGEGTGLGLSITKGILDEHKATISVLDHEPHTCFEVRFKKMGLGYSAN